nr:tetratricopeptide repeat protein [Jiella sp. LLJ827]
MFLLGIFYDKGYTVEKSDEQSFDWTLRAAEAGLTDAMINVSINYCNGTGAIKNNDKAFSQANKAYELKHIDSFPLMHHFYRNGIGVRPDQERAIEFLAEGIKFNSAECMRILGSCYEFGDGVTKDPAKAVEWYRRAAEMADPRAMLSLASHYEAGICVEEDPAEALRWYRSAAYKGDGHAMWKLGMYYMYGRGVVERDLMQAVKWFGRAADKRYAAAMDAMGGLYLNGIGVERDAARAVEWFRRAILEENFIPPKGRWILATLSAVVHNAAINAMNIQPSHIPVVDIPSQVKWLDSPPFSEEWLRVSVDEANEIARKIARAAALEGDRYLFYGMRITALRKVKLLFYPAFDLIDVQLSDVRSDKAKFLSALVSVNGAVLLGNGTKRLLVLNPFALNLNLHEEIVNYLKLYCQMNRNENGPFVIVSSTDDLPFVDDAALAEFHESEIALSAPSLTRYFNDRQSAELYSVSAFVLNGDALFRSEFKIFSNGQITMPRHEQVAADLLIETRRYQGYFRIRPGEESKN